MPSKDPLRARKHLSANTLFHFTRKRENLLGILRKNFLPRYCLERVAGSYPARQALKQAVPMVSFCDIPLSQIKNHARDYGSWAIGLEKSWALKRGIAPVFYVPVNSQTDKMIIKMFQDLGPFFSPLNNQIRPLTQDIVYFSLFVKEYEGRLERPRSSYRKVRFYDEHEWRYVPPLDNRRSDLTPVVLEEAKFRNPESLNRSNDAIGKAYPLLFMPKVIRYIIVPRERDILDIRNDILEIKAGYPPKAKELLTTRIVSMEHIIDDF